METSPVIRLYIVQRTKTSPKEQIQTAEPFEELIRKYYAVKMVN